MRKIPLGSGKYTLVDDEDFEWLNQYLWCIGTFGYVYNNVRYSLLSGNLCSPISSMHRLILGLEPGDPRQADHKNHNILDNRRCNLRICTRSQNHGNRKNRVGFTSKYKGVYWSKPNKKWHAKIGRKEGSKHIGSYKNERTAALAYNLAAKKYYGKFALLNKI